MSLKNIFKSKHKSLIAGILLLSMAAWAVETVFYSTSGLSKFRYYTNSDGQKVAEKTIQNYDVVRKYAGGSVSLYLLNTQLMRQEFINLDGVTGNLKWNVRTGSNFGSVLYSKSEKATLYDLSDLQGLMVTGLEGCCAEMTGYRLYDVPTGKLIISFNDFTNAEVVRHPFTLEVPNSSLGNRFLGMISGDSTRDRDFVVPEAGYSNVALLKYASLSAFFQRLQVDMQVAAGYAPSILEVNFEADPSIPGSGTIEFREGLATLWNADGATDPHAIQGVRLRFVVNGGMGDKVIIIPIREDRLSLSEAVIPPGVKIHAL